MKSRTLGLVRILACAWWLLQFIEHQVIASKSILKLYDSRQVGLPRFELGSDGPQPPSIGQANPQALALESESF